MTVLSSVPANVLCRLLKRMVELIWEEFGVLRSASGRVTMAELDATAAQLQADARLDDLRHIIHDFTGATEILVSQDDIDFMALRASIALQKNMRVKIAFVGDHPVVHALIHAFNVDGVSNHRCQRFDTLAEARAYTSLPA